MKKRVFIGVLAALMLFAFVACDNSVDPSQSGVAVKLYSEDCPVYFVGQEINLSDWTVNGINAYGNVVSVDTSDLVLAGDKKVAEDQTEVKVETAWGASGTLSIKTIKVDSISVDATNAPEVTYYATSDKDYQKAIDSTGVVVKATYTDTDGVKHTDETIDNSLVSFTLADWATPSETAAVTVAFGGASDANTFKVKLSKNLVESIEISAAEYEPIVPNAAKTVALDTAKFKVYGNYINGEKLVLTPNTDVQYSLDSTNTNDKKTYVNSSSIAFTEAKNYTVYVKYVGDDRAENINKYAFANVTAKADSLVDISVAFNNFTVAADFDYSTEEKYADIDSKITVKGVYASKEETSALTAWEDYRITPEKPVSSLEKGDLVTLTIVPRGDYSSLPSYKFVATIGEALGATD